MPVIVTTPQTGEPFGPGFVVSAATDSFGPWPAGTFWNISLEDSDGIEFITWERIYTQAGFISLTLLNKPSELPARASAAPHTGTLHGDPALLRVIFVPQGSATQETVVTVELDRQQGQVQELAAILQAQTTASPTLTEEEHNAVLQTNVGVIAMSGLNVAELIAGAATAIAANPPLGWGTMSGAYTITGDGELPDLHEFAHDRFGVYWIATVIPPGLGHFHGNTEEYQTRLVQWRTTHVVGGIEMVTEVLDASWHGGLWRFGTKLPEKVQYSILPGVTLEARWWQFP